MKQKGLSAMFYRDGRLFLASLWRTLLLGLCFALICGALAFAAFSSLTSEAKKPISLALVDEDNSMISRVALNYVRSQKNIAAIVSAELTNEEKALLGMENGDYLGAIILPRGYLNAIMDGDPVRGRVLIANSSMANADSLHRLVGVGENLIRMGQYGVFAGASVVWDQRELRPIYDTYILRINDALIYEATTATDRYIIDEELPYSKTLPLLSHTLLTSLLTVLSLFTLLFYRSSTADLTPQKASRLWASGVSKAAFLIPKIALAFAFRLGFTALILVPLVPLLSLSPNAVDIAALVLALLMVCLLDTLLTVALAGNRFGVALFSLSLLLELFCIGGILPLSYLSDIIVSIGECLPLGLAYRCSATFFGSENAPLALLGLLLWTLPVLLAAILRMRRISVEGGQTK